MRTVSEIVVTELYEIMVENACFSSNNYNPRFFHVMRSL